MTYPRGAVVKGPDVLGGHEWRPYVCLSDDSHPFADQEGLFVAITTTRRSVAIPLADEDFEVGGLPRESYVNPWTITTIKHADMAEEEGHLVDETVESIAREAAEYLGVE